MAPASTAQDLTDLDLPFLLLQWLTDYLTGSFQLVCIQGKVTYFHFFWVYLKIRFLVPTYYINYTMRKRFTNSLC